MTEISLDKYKKAYEQVIMHESRKEVVVHAIIFVLVNVMFLIVNLVYSPGELWFFYPLIGWGIGLLLHYLNGVVWIMHEVKEKEAKAEYIARGGHTLAKKVAKGKPAKSRKK